MSSAIPANRIFIFLAIVVVGGVADLLTKEVIFSWPYGPGAHGEYWLLKNFFGIQKAMNKGALFGMGQGYYWLFAAMSVLAAIGIVSWLFVWKGARDLLLTVALSCVSAGIVGNLYDRVIHRAVRDWILVCYYDHVWPNFNIADCFLVCGAAFLAWQAFFPPASATCPNSPK